jgi:pyruvate kinase
VIAESENIIDYQKLFEAMKDSQGIKLSAVDTLVTTACTIALENNVDLILCLTENGKLARCLSKFRMEQPILACSTDSSVVRQTNMLKGVIGYKIPSFISKFQDKLLDLVLKNAQEQDLCEPGSKVMIFTSLNEGKHGEMVNFALKEIEQLEEEEDEEVMSGENSHE